MPHFTSHSAHRFSITNIIFFMLFIELIVVKCEIHAKHINTLCGHNANHFNVKAGSKYVVLETIH